MPGATLGHALRRYTSPFALFHQPCAVAPGATCVNVKSFVAPSIAISLPPDWGELASPRRRTRAPAGLQCLEHDRGKPGLDSIRVGFRFSEKAAFGLDPTDRASPEGFQRKARADDDAKKSLTR